MIRGRGKEEFGNHVFWSYGKILTPWLTLVPCPLRIMLGFETQNGVTMLHSLIGLLSI